MPNYISPTRWNTILTKLNQKRTDGGFSTVSTEFSGYVKQSNIDTLRNGLIDILTKYGYSDLNDALNHVGYDYITWKSWDYNFIATRSLDEIENILDSMYYHGVGDREYLEDIVLSTQFSGSYYGSNIPPYHSGQYLNFIVKNYPGWVYSATGGVLVGLYTKFECPSQQSTHLTQKFPQSGNYTIIGTSSFVKINDNSYKIIINHSCDITGRYEGDVDGIGSARGANILNTQPIGTILPEIDTVLFTSLSHPVSSTKDIKTPSAILSVNTNYHDYTEPVWNHY